MRGLAIQNIEADAGDIQAGFYKLPVQIIISDFENWARHYGLEIGYIPADASGRIRAFPVVRKRRER